MLAGDAAYLSKSELSTLQNEHVLRSHIPYLATCEECQRARGLSPQRRLHESQRPRNEIQADKFWFRGVAMLVLVAVGVGMLGTILWQPDRESMVSSFVRWSRSAGLAGSGEVTVSMRSDREPALVSFLERCCRELPSASLEQVPVDRHAPNAEGAIRTLKELAQVQVCSLEKVGSTVAQGGVPYLFSHLSVAHNRYHIEEGSALTPEQRCRQKRLPAHPTYIFGASVLCMPPPSVAHLVNGRLCKGAYLGPEVASASHWVRVQLNSGEFRIVRSPKIRMLMRLRYEVGLLRGICRLLPGRDRPPDFPPLEVDAMKALPLPNTNTRGPPKEWIAEHGKTPRCRACKIKGIDSDKALHTPACRARYAKFLRESFSPEATIAQDRELDQELGFDPAVPDLGGLGFEGLGDYVELPRDVLPEGSGTYDNDPLYEPDITDDEGQLPAHPEGEIANEEAADLMDVEPEPLDRIPEGVAMAFAERFEHHEAIGQVAAPVQEGDKGGEIIVELGGGLVKVQRPCASRDDVTEVSLDLGLTYEGMIKELKALESLSVGDMMWTIDPKQRIISTRWVVAAKNERIDGKETPIVRCRIVARDYSTGPSASQLGISSPTASGEALKLFLGLDVSTAFLFAWLGDEKVVVSMPEGCVGPGGEKLYLRLKKALYGLRSAALHWTRHLSGLLGKLFGLKPCPTEPCLFTGYFKNKRVFVLSYVDDLLLAGASTDDLYEMVELLRKELKLKVTADLAKDGKIHFLGREILRSEPGGDLKFGMDPGYMQDVLEEYKLENAKGLPIPPCLRDLLDKSLDEASLQVPLTPEAAARYRRALGKLSWLSATRGDLVYYISVLARGQSSPLEVHERAMRAVLRYLKTVVHYFQVFPRQRHSHMLLRAYVDASWGSERSVERRSISGGCLMLGKACIKSWARLQQSVALSSAESELYALVEGSREALGARCAVGHILGHEEAIVPHIYCDSEAAVNISKMEGLRKLRHIDIRACFIQTEVQAGAIKVFSVKGTENPADIFTKNLDFNSTLKHMQALGLRSTLLPEGVRGLASSVLRACVVRETPNLRERFRPNSQHKWLFVEFCAPLLSGLARVCAREFPRVHVLTVTASDDGTKKETCEDLLRVFKEARDRGPRVFFWSSTPCTGGCPYQRLNLSRYGTEYQKHLDGLWAVHRKLWAVVKIMSNLSDHWAVEWPARCAYWKQTESCTPHTLMAVPPGFSETTVFL